MLQRTSLALLLSFALAAPAPALPSLRNLCARWFQTLSPPDRSLHFGHPLREAPKTADELFDAFRHGLVPDLADPQQRLAWEIYRKAKFGNPNYELLADTDQRIDRFLKNYPNVAKQPFCNASMVQARWQYTRPAGMEDFLKGHRRAVHELKQTLSEIDKNLGFWAKRLGIDKKFAHIPTAPDRNAAIEAAVREIFPEEFRITLVDRQKPAAERWEMLYRKISELRDAASYEKKTGDPLAQVLADIAHVQGFDDALVEQNLNDSQPLTVISGYRKALLFRHMFLERMGVEHGWEGFLAKTGVKKPTNVPVDALLNGQLNALYQEIDRTKKRLEGPGTKKVIRLLSLVESAERSCLGEDCATRTYLETGLDPNFHYWTLTDPSTGHSSGHVTTVLGTVGKQKVAFIDKIQNVRNEELGDFLEGIRKANLELGYVLVLPEHLSQVPSGFSNDYGTTAFVGALPQYRSQKTALGQFVPHNSGFSHLPVGYSASRLKLAVKALLPLETETTYVMEPHTAAPWRTREIDVGAIVAETHRLKEGTPEDKARYLSIEPALPPERRDPAFDSVVKEWGADPALPFPLRKEVLSFLLRNGKTDAVVAGGESLTQEERNQLLDGWLQSDITHQAAVRALPLLLTWATGNDFLMRQVVQKHTRPDQLMAWASGKNELLDLVAMRLSSANRIALLSEHGESARDSAMRRVVDKFLRDTVAQGGEEQIVRSFAAWAKKNGRRPPMGPHVAAWFADESVAAKDREAAAIYYGRIRTPGAFEAAQEYVRTNHVPAIVLDAAADPYERINAAKEVAARFSYDIAHAFSKVPAKTDDEKIFRAVLRETLALHSFSSSPFEMKPAQIRYYLATPSTANSPLRAEAFLLSAKDLLQKKELLTEDRKQLAFLLQHGTSAEAAAGGRTFPQASRATDDLDLTASVRNNRARLLTLAKEKGWPSMLDDFSSLDEPDVAELFLTKYDGMAPKEAHEFAEKHRSKLGTKNGDRIRAHLARPRLAMEPASSNPEVKLLGLSTALPTSKLQDSVTIRRPLRSSIVISAKENVVRLGDKDSLWLDGPIDGFLPLGNDMLLVKYQTKEGFPRHHVLHYSGGNGSDLRIVHVPEPDPFRYGGEASVYYDKKSNFLVVESPYSRSATALLVGQTSPTVHAVLPRFQVTADGVTHVFNREAGMPESEHLYPVNVRKGAATQTVQVRESVELPGGTKVLYDGGKYLWVKDGVVLSSLPVMHTAMSGRELNAYNERHIGNIAERLHFGGDPALKPESAPYFPKRMTVLPDGTVFVASQRGNYFEWLKDGKRVGSASPKEPLIASNALLYIPTPEGNVVALGSSTAITFDLKTGETRSECFSDRSEWITAAAWDPKAKAIRVRLAGNSANKPREVLLVRK